MWSYRCNNYRKHFYALFYRVWTEHIHILSFSLVDFQCIIHSLATTDMLFTGIFCFSLLEMSSFFCISEESSVKNILQIKIYQNQKSPWMSEIIFQLCLRFSLFNLSSTVSVISCLTSTEVSATHPYPTPTYKHAYTFAHINKLYVGKYIRKKMLYIMLHCFSRKQL